MLSPARTWVLLLVLGAIGIAVAVGVTVAAGRVRPAGSFGPLASAELTRIDVHQHVLPGTVDEALRLARAEGIDAFVNVQGGTADGGLPRQLEAAARGGGRILVFAQLDPAGCCDEAWTAREVARVGEARRLGARGLSVTEAFSRAVDDPGVAPVWEECAREGLPVLVHVADRDAFARAALLHPDTAFVGAHFAGSAADPEWVKNLLDRAPNAHVDTAACIPDLGRHAEAVRALVLAHPDRVLFGTDLQYVEAGGVKAVIFGAGMPGGREDMLQFFDGTWRFFETRDEEIPSPTPATGDQPVEGLGLPRRVLQLIYRDNAARLLHLGPAEGAR